MVLAGHKCTVGMESVSEPQDTEQGARHGKQKRASGANSAWEEEGQAAVTQAKKKRRPKQDTMGVSQGLQVCVRASMQGEGFAWGFRLGGSRRYFCLVLIFCLQARGLQFFYRKHNAWKLVFVRNFES